MIESFSLKTHNLPSLNSVLQHVTSVYPGHDSFLSKGFSIRSESELKDSELIAEWILKVAGKEILSYCQDYQWTCDQLLGEELEFRRSGRYRFQKLEELEDFVYQNPTYMARYLRGLLLSQLLWNNHFYSFSFLLHRFIPQNPHRYRHLEIGPGHGLLLHLASSDPRCDFAEGWDISPTALEETQRSLSALDDRTAKLKLCDASKVESTGPGSFDSIVMSEILEHVEDPRSLLISTIHHLKPEGRLFINVPINSPAPDHLYLLTSPQEAVELIESCGLEIMEKEFFPMTGYSLEKATKFRATISVVIVARKKS